MSHGQVCLEEGTKLTIWHVFVEGLKEANVLQILLSRRSRLVFSLTHVNLLHLLNKKAEDITTFSITPSQNFLSAFQSSTIFPTPILHILSTQSLVKFSFFVFISIDLTLNNEILVFDPEEWIEQQKTFPTVVPVYI